MKNKTVSFSLDQDEYEKLYICSKSIGLTVSQFCKTAAFSHTKRFKEILRQRRIKE